MGVVIHRDPGPNAFQRVEDSLPIDLQVAD
jgi:hypothetical protein